MTKFENRNLSKNMFEKERAASNKKKGQFFLDLCIMSEELTSNTKQEKEIVKSDMFGCGFCGLVYTLCRWTSQNLTRNRF